MHAVHFYCYCRSQLRPIIVFSWATYDTHAKLAKRQLTIKLLAWGSKQYLADSWNKMDFFVVLVSDAVYLIEKFFTKGLSKDC